MPAASVCLASCLPAAWCVRACMYVILGGVLCFDSLNAWRICCGDVHACPCIIAELLLGEGRRGPSGGICLANVFGVLVTHTLPAVSKFMSTRTPASHYEHTART